MAYGTLYAIGVGPGAPDLICLRAVNILARVEVVFAAASPKNEESLALSIASPHLSQGARIVRLDFPMTQNREELEQAWQIAAETSLEILANGDDAAFLTLGDPSIYSTFGYLAKSLLQIVPDLPIEIVPGITSWQAAAARAHINLCEGTQSLGIIAGTLPEAEIRRQLCNTDTAVILKVYRNWTAIAKALEDSGRATNTLLASYVEREQEQFGSNLQDKPPYMSLIISKKP